MKRVIHHIYDCKSLSAHTIIATGVGGTIQIEFHLPEIVHITYAFEGVPVDADLQEASSYMTAPLAGLVCAVTVEMTEAHDLYRLPIGQTDVSAEKIN
mgnify:CR=1 FL=1